MRKFSLVFFSMILFAGCAAKKFVENENTFVHSRSPSIRIQVDQDLKYLGEANFQTTGKWGDWADTMFIQAFPFAQLDQENRVIKVVVIDFVTTRSSGSYWESAGTGPDEMLCDRAFKFSCGQLRDNELGTLMGQRGFKTDSSYAAALWNRILNPNELMQIGYFEIIPAAILWASPQEQQDFLQELKSRAAEAFTVVHFDLF